MPYSGLATSAGWIWRALESHGVEPEPLFRRAGMDPAKMLDPDARYKEAKFYRLMNLAVEATGNPYFGLEVGEYWHPSHAHALGYAWLASQTLLDALERTARFFKVLSDKEELVLEDLGEAYRLLLQNLSPRNHPTADEEYDSMMAGIVDLSRYCAGEDFAPLRVSLTRVPPPDPERFHRHFRCPVHFRANENVMVFDAESLRRPLPTSNPAVAQANDRIVADYLARFDRGGVQMQVRSKLLEQLSSGHATQESVARSLHMSSRNLQRKLKDDGTTYKDLLDQTRRDLAEQYVRQKHLSIKEITYLLGFSESANFSRAFKRWTGRSPSEFRDEQLTAPVDPA